MGISAHQFRMIQDMVFHFQFHFMAFRSARGGQNGIERIRFEQITVFARWRLGAIVFDSAKVISALRRHHRNAILLDVMSPGVNVEKNPMVESSIGRVRIIHNQRQAARPLRNALLLCFSRKRRFAV